MFKKVEIWVLYLVILLGIPLMFGFGFLVRQELRGQTKYKGRLTKTALFLAELPVNIKKVIVNTKNIDLSVEDRFPSLDGFTGIPNSQESYMLLSRYDGDLGEGKVELVDLSNFKVLHTWNPDFDGFNKTVNKINEFKFINRDNNNSRQLLHHLCAK